MEEIREGMEEIREDFMEERLLTYIF